MAQAGVRLQRGKRPQFNMAPVPEHMLLFLVLAELVILIGLRNIFKSAHGG